MPSISTSRSYRSRISLISAYQVCFLQYNERWQSTTAIFSISWNMGLLFVDVTGWSHSSPQINRLDQIRTEYYIDDGTMVIKCSTREWAPTLFEQDGKTPALCDIVNMTNDKKSYLVLVPTNFLQQAQQHWRLCKSCLLPPSHREARFWDNLLGLPEVMEILTEKQSNISFLEVMASKHAWRQRTDPEQYQKNDESRMALSKSQHRAATHQEQPTLPTWSSTPPEFTWPKPSPLSDNQEQD